MRTEWITRAWSGTKYVPLKLAQDYYAQTVRDFGKSRTKLVQDTVNPKLWSIKLKVPVR